MNSTMFNAGDILETIRMIQDECLDIRTTTMGISLLDCICLLYTSPSPRDA